MTTMTKTRSSKPRREVTESSLPLDENGKLDLVRVLVLALTVPGRLSNCYNKFHRYSFLNMVLVFLQTGKLEPMATFNRWKTLGRTIISGPGSALFVNHPKFAPVTDRATGLPIKKANGKIEMKVVGFYPKATVFQLFQTDGPELEMPETPEWDKEQAMEHLDITEVTFRKGDGNTQGYSHEREFALNPVAESPFKTMMHEWAHILLGHTAADYQYAAHQGVAEFQAEAVALLVCRELDVEGFDEANSRGYIQHWLDGDSSEYVNEHGELAVNDHVVREIFSATDKILLAGRKSHYDQLDVYVES